MNNPWPGISFGVALVGIGLSFLMSHIRTWRRQRDNPDLEESERTFYERRFRRRRQIASLLIIIGVLLGAGDVALSMPPFNRSPLFAAFVVLTLLLMTGWVMLLAIAEVWSTAANAKAELARVERKRRELERQIVELKYRSPHGPSSGWRNDER